MERTQIGGNRILIILLILIISTILSACAVGNDPENSFPASERTTFILYNPTSQDTSSLTPSVHLQEYDLLLSLILLLRTSTVHRQPSTLF